MTQRCETCRFWLGTTSIGENYSEGLCRAYAPRPEKGEGSVIMARWPTTAHNDWCGEHELNDKAFEESVP